MSTLCGVSARTFLVFMGVLALVGLLGFGLISKGEGSLAVGDPVPTTELAALKGQETGSVADHGGKWVLVNVWASWCGPCRDEAPALQRFYERRAGDDFEIVGIDTQETAEAGRGFVEEFGLTYPQLHDGAGEYADELKTKGVPENFLIDPEGDVALVQAGPVTEDFLDTQVAPMIEGS
jgi:cytochrome c biogenesis protein CcmG, thiol:disulfide interchange protein DsbE